MIKNLAYVGFESPSAHEWRTFGPEVLGAELAPDQPDGAVRLRVDNVAHRITIRPGERNDLAYLGWQVDDVGAVVAAVEGAGLTVEDDAFVDPLGFRHEFVTKLDQGPPFTPGRSMSGFVTDEQGLGHVVLIVPDLAAAAAFYTDVRGFRPSDSIEGRLPLRFFHCAGHAARHHTIAMASVPGMVGMHHLMLEVRSIDDVGAALDIANERNIRLAMTLGRHTNDLMTSFYMRSPSGFEIEYGTGGLVVDDDSWKVTTYDTGDIWGHKPPAEPMLPEIIRPFQTA
jgi:extradiol dioxygenase